MLWRLTLAYVIWGVVQWPILWKIYQMTDPWGVYRLCLLFPLISWHAALLYHYKQEDFKQTVRGPLILVAISAMLLALGVSGNVFVGALISVLGLLLLRAGLTGESLFGILKAGGVVAVLLVPLPLNFLEKTSSALIGLHSLVVPAVLKCIAKIPVQKIGPETFEIAKSAASWGLGGVAKVKISGECSGLRSLFAILSFSCYCTSAQRLDWPAMAIVASVGGIMAVFLNMARIALYSICLSRGSSYWASPSGHELSGLILVAIGIIVVRFLARHIMVEVDESGERSVLPAADSSKAF